MDNEGGLLLSGALTSDRYQRRLAKAHRFEQVEGAGPIKQLERLLVAPSLYIPYVLNAKLGLSRTHLTAMSLFWGRRIRIPLDDYDALILYMYGGLHGDEMKYTKFLIKNLRPDDVFYDIGANRGFYTFLAADLCKETHTFEVIAELANIVTVNLRPEDTIVVNPVAVSDSNGTVELNVMDSTMTNTINSSVAELLSVHEHPIKDKIIVPSITLDSYLETHPKPTFLKIDVEGAEEQVLEGGKIFFSTHSPVIAMEIWGKENKWELSMKAADLLRSMGYTSYRLTENGDVEVAEGDLSKEVSPVGGENFIFKK